MKSKNYLWHKALLLMIFVSLLSLNVTAVNFYWVGGSGNWSDMNHWATTSGGSVPVGGIPTANDNVYFDQPGNYNVTIDTDNGVFCKDMTWSGTGTSTLLMQGKAININGSLTLRSGMTIPGNRANPGVIVFNSSLPGQTIRTNGVMIDQCIVFKGTGGWKLLDNLYLTTNGGFENENAYIDFQNGDLDFNQKNVIAHGFYSPGNTSPYSNTRKLNIKNSQITVAGDITSPPRGGAKGWSYSGGQALTSVETANSLIKLVPSSNSLYNNGGIIAKSGDVYYNVEISGRQGDNTFINDGIYNKITCNSSSTLSLDNMITTDTLVLNPSFNYIIQNSITVNKFLNAYPSGCSGFIGITSGSQGSQQTIILGASATAQIGNAEIRDIKILGPAGTYTAINSRDEGNNTNISFSTPTTQIYYWVGGSGNWTDKNHWANVSGGTPGSGCVPTPFDNVVFDNNSGLPSSSNVVFVDKYGYCNNMSWMGSGSPILKLGEDLEVNGSLLFQKGMNVTNQVITETSNSAIIMASSNMGQTITTNNISINVPMQFNSTKGTGGWILQDSLKLKFDAAARGNYISFYAGDLNFNGNYVSAAEFQGGSGLPSRNLNIANSTIELKGTYTLSPYSAGWYYPGTHTIMDASKTSNSLIRVFSSQSYGVYTNSSETYNNVEFLGGTSAINGGIFNSINFKTTSGTIGSIVSTDSLIYSKIGTFYFNSNTKVNEYLATPAGCGGSGSLNGSSGQKTITMGNPSTVNVSNMTLTNLKITGPGIPYYVENGVDGGGNTNWTFGGRLSKTFYWVGGLNTDPVAGGDNTDWGNYMNWALTSGGAPGSGCVPSTLDNVFFDSKSGFSSSYKTVKIAAGTCDSITIAGCVVSPIFSLSGGSLSIYGSAIFQSGMNFNGGGSTSFMYFRSSRMGETIKTNGAYINPSTVFDSNGGTGGWKLLDDYNASTAVYTGVYFTRGNLDLNGKNVTANRFSYSNGANTGSASRILNMANSTITVTGTARGFHFAGSNAVLADATNSKIISGGPVEGNVGQKYNYVELTTSTSITNGTYNRVYCRVNATITKIITDTLQFSPGGKTYSFSSTSTDTTIINKLWITAGTPCIRTIIQSTTAGIRANIGMPKTAANVAPDTVRFEFVRLRDLNVITGPQWAIFKKGNQCPDEADNKFGIYGNNTNWTMLPYLDPAGFKGLGNDVVLGCTDSYLLSLDPLYRPTLDGSAYEWRQTNASGAIIGSNDPEFKASSPGTYFLKIYYDNAVPRCTLSTTKTLYAAPDTLIWTGNVDANWNNYNNWKNASGVTDITTVPRNCTNVLIPAGRTIYPILDLLNTSRSEFPDAACKNIHFEFGGEVARTDSLHYTKAYFDLTLSGNRWYMLSAPLQGMFPGDYYKISPSPVADGLLVYTQLYTQANPQGNASGMTSLSGNWTGTFNTPDVVMPAGFGFAAWLDDNTPISTHNPTTMSFPKHDMTYNYYNTAGKVVGTVNIPRSNEHRFVYEPVIDASGNITLSSRASGTGETAIVGNPFLSHWNFNQFYLKNNTSIAQEYKLLVNADDGAFTTYTPAIPNGLSNLIAPMQSVVVTAVANFSSLSATATSSETMPGITLKSERQAPVLSITASANGKQNNAYILFNAQSSNNSHLNEDSYKLFVESAKEPVVIYTRSEDGYALDINSFGDYSKVIPIGIRTSQMGTIRLDFGGLENFLPGTIVYLNDALTGNWVNLRETPAYSFNKTTKDLYLDERFYLSFVKIPTGMDDISKSNASIFVYNNQLQVVGSDNSNLKEVQVLDLQGRIVLRETGINRPSYTHSLQHDQMFIVKVIDQKGVTVKKIIAAN